MHKTFSLVFSVLSLVFYSQTIKTDNYKLRFETLPSHPINTSYKNYTFEFFANYSDNKDYLPDVLKLTNIDIKGFKNISILPYSETKGLIKQFPNFRPSHLKVCAQPVSDFKIKYNIGNIEFVSQNQGVKKVNTAQGTASEYYYMSTFNYFYSVVIVDKNNKIIFDSAYTVTKTLGFPNDYNYDQFGNKNIAKKQFLSLYELDVNFKQCAGYYYELSKTVLIQQSIDELNKYFNTRFEYDSDYETVEFSWVKSKDLEFKFLDTAKMVFETLIDSIASNVKKENHMNWHTKFINRNAEKLLSYLLNANKNEALVNKFSSSIEKDFYKRSMKYDLVFAYIFLDKYNEAKKIYYEVREEFTNGFNKNGSKFKDLYDLEAIILREETVFNLNKDFFGWR